MPALAQGQIWWAELSAPAGRRPVLILTRSEAIPRLANVTVAPITRTVRGIDSEVFLTPEDGPPTECAVSLDNIVTIRKSILSRPIASLADQRMASVFDAIRFAFAMEPKAR